MTPQNANKLVLKPVETSNLYRRRREEKVKADLDESGPFGELDEILQNLADNNTRTNSVAPNVQYTTLADVQNTEKAKKPPGLQHVDGRKVHDYRFS